jgi:phosphoglycolate phosphatase
MINDVTLSLKNLVRLAVFDCDGTLVDSQHSHIAAMETAFDIHRMARPDPRGVLRLVGLPLMDTMERLLPECNPDTHSRVQEGYRQAYTEMRLAGEVREPLFPGAVEGLESLKLAGWVLGVATGKGRQGLLDTLGGHGLVSRFMTLQTADVAEGKPSPDMLNRAMNDAGAAPETTVMIGDTTFDMEMARNAGTMAIGVTWGYHEPGELMEAGAHRIVSTFGEVPEAVEDLMEAGI